MSKNLSIKTLSTATDLEDILQLIAAYQNFYECKPDLDGNRTFFGQFFKNPAKGIQFAAYLQNKPVGFATLFFPLSSTNVNSYCLMNDLFVTDSCRGHGVGRKLIHHCTAFAREKGFNSLEWMTMQSNSGAQKLYDRFHQAKKTAWYSYSIPV